MSSKFKQTELGLIPADWQESSVGIEFEVQLGKMLDAAKNTGVFKPYLGNRSVQWNRVETENLPEMAMSYSDTKRFRLSKGDLLVCEGGEIGRAAIWEDEIPECYYQKALHRLRPTNGFNVRFMLALLNYWAQHDLLSHLVSQTSIAHLSKEQFVKVPLPVPKPEEQRAIAEALSDVDSLINALDALITKKRHIKQGTMQQLLTGKKRLPGFDSTDGKFQSTEAGMIPADWELGSVGTTTSKVGSGITPTGGSTVYTASGRPFMRSQNVGWGQLRLDDVAYIDEATHASFAGSEIQNQDVFLNITGASIGRSAIADERVVGGNVNQHVCIIRTLRDELAPTFLNLVLLSDYGQRKIDSFQAGGNREGLNFGQIKSFIIPLPSVNEQVAIAEVLLDMDAQIPALEQKRDKTKLIKQGMMQELLTGKTRLV